MNILVSGLVNVETTLRVRRFPLDYYPVDYPFFGVKSAVGGVGFNVSKALKTLGSRPLLHSMVADDAEGRRAVQELERLGIPVSGVRMSMKETPSSVVIHDGEGRRQIHCDLKDIQDRRIPFSQADLAGVEMAVACNINFSRPLIRLAKAAKVPVATDLHVLRGLDDDYCREFLEGADVVFLSDEGILGGYGHGDFARDIARRFGTKLVVVGEGAKGVTACVRTGVSTFRDLAGAVDGDDDSLYGDGSRACRTFSMPAARAAQVANTVGAGDALFSAFLHFWTKGETVEGALDLAQNFAAAKIAVNGAAEGFVSEAECRKRARESAVQKG